MKNNWSFRNFESCIEKIPKVVQLKTSDYQSEGKYPIVSQESDLISGYTDKEEYVNHFTKPLVVFGDHSRVIKYIDFDFAVGADGVKILIPKDEIMPKFFYYYLKWHGVMSLGYSRHYKLLKETPIPIPQYYEQQQIAEELDLLSTIIEKKKIQLKKLDNLAQSIFYDMFGDPVENEKGWEVKELNEIAQIGTGATPSRKKEDLYYGGNISWVKTTEVQNCDIIDTEEKITQLAIDQTNCKVYPPDTLLMAMYGQGKTRGQIAKLKIEAATNQACAAIQHNSSLCETDYLFQHLHIQYELIRNMAQGGNQQNLNIKKVGSIPIMLPPIHLQQEFVTAVLAIKKQKEAIIRSIAETQQLFDSRMAYWFN